MAVEPPLALRLLSLYPRKMGSRVIGALARLSLPAPLREPLLGRFARSYGVDLNEADRKLPEYGSFLDFFTRRLRPGLRPQDSPVPGAVNSPVDGEVIASGHVTEGALIQAKGLPYRLTELLANDPLTDRFFGASYLTIYLAPRDYHRIHVPLEGTCLAVSRVEGELWPVNEASTAFMPGLYVRNRRATWFADGSGPCEGLSVAVVMVAATHVGGVAVDARWLGGKTMPRTGRIEPGSAWGEPGDDLAAFELGSTVVLLVGGPRAGEWKACRTRGRVQVGQRLGAFAIEEERRPSRGV